MWGLHCQGAGAFTALPPQSLLEKGDEGSLFLLPTCRLRAKWAQARKALGQADAAGVHRVGEGWPGCPGVSTSAFC